MEMLITQALDERDLLRKKIEDAIKGQRFVSCKKKSAQTDVYNAPVDKITADIKSTYQSINDMIDRYYMIIQKIAESNAVTTITVDGKTMTISAAISIIKDINNRNYLKTMLQNKLERDYNAVSDAITKQNRIVEQDIKNLLNALVSKSDSKTPTEEDTNFATLSQEKNVLEFIDPLNITDKINDLNEQNTDLRYKILSAIKVSNATTVIDI